MGCLGCFGFRERFLQGASSVLKSKGSLGFGVEGLKEVV